MKVDLSETVELILERNTNLIFMDTCSLIDIVRSPYRKDIHNSHVSGAKELIEMHKKDLATIVVTDTIEIEFNEHLSNTCTELERHMAKLQSENNSLIEILETIGLSFEFSIKGMDKLQLSEKLREMANKIFDAAICVTRDTECANKAHDRVERNITPSRKGKSESKDCLIIEHYLKISKDIRARGFNKGIVFISSNQDDYGKSPNPKDPLNLDFERNKIVYCNNILWAITELKKIA